ncbi:MAG: tetratricopeptide repeat protein [Desulfobacterales bacterium]|nr:tetratricopeptide repeat protein [Desulfobacterales bacterium]
MHYNLGVLFGRTGNYRAESQAYMRATRLKPDYAKAYCNLGVAYAQMGFYSKAVWAFENAIRLNPNDTVARQNYAKIKSRR